MLYTPRLIPDCRFVHVLRGALEVNTYDRNSLQQSSTSEVNLNRCKIANGPIERFGLLSMCAQSPVCGKFGSPD
jgi:hypothetical protein